MKNIECVKENGQTIIPIFYHVDPTDVRKQTRSFQEAFINHEKAKRGRNKEVENNLNGSEQYLEMASREWVIIILFISIYEFSPSDIAYWWLFFIFFYVFSLHYNIIVFGPSLCPVIALNH